MVRKYDPSVVLQSPILRKSGNSQFCDWTRFDAVRHLQNNVRLVASVFVVDENNGFVLYVLQGERRNLRVRFVFKLEMATIGLNDVYYELLRVAVWVLDFYCVGCERRSSTLFSSKLKKLGTLVSSGEGKLD